MNNLRCPKCETDRSGRALSSPNVMENAANDTASAYVEDGRLAYSVNEFAKICGLGRTSIFEAIRVGELRAVKKGRRTLIPATDGRRWILADDSSSGRAVQ